MPNVLVRDLDTETLDKLKERAARRSRSLQSELLEILKCAAVKSESLSELETARKIRNSLKVKNQADSVELLREDRRGR